MMKAKKIKKWYTTAQVLFCLTPILFYIQTSYKVLGTQMDLQGILQQDPAVAISFLIAIINPFVAYQLQHFKKELDRDEPNVVIVSLIGLVAAQMLLGNLFYVSVLVFLAIQTYRYSGTRINKTYFTNKTTWKYLVPNACLLAMSGLCFYASIKIM